jgi:FAD:protein FMN transferase
MPGELTKLWRRAFRQKEFPTASEIEAARKTVGFKDLELKKNTAQLKKTGMRLDLGGIAKGYAVDEAMAVIRSHGITVALVDGGGDMLAGDAPPGNIGWLIEKPALGKDGLTTEKIPLKNAAIATSGDTYKFLEHDGKRYSHILDPRTGMGITSRQLVTVTAPTCMEADAWATAMSVEVNTDAFLWLQKQGIVVELKLY